MNEQDIQKTERRWAAIVIVAMAIILVVTGVSSFVMAMHPPSHVETIDPTTLGGNKEFAENNLGARVNPDGSVTVRIIAAQFAFVPRMHPRAARKAGGRFGVTSPDVIHGFLIAGTNANTMVVPGYVPKFTRSSTRRAII